MKDWTLVFKTPIHSRAEIVKGVLTSREIDAVIVNKKDSTLHVSHGLVEVMVPNKNAIRAKKIVEDEIKFE